MQLHNLKPKTKSKTRKRIGRGGKRGTFSGRGVKGQKSRAGTHKGEPIIRGIIKRFPKLRGYRYNPKKEFEIILDLSVIEKKFKDNDKITVDSLLKAGLIGKIKGRRPEVKILAKGDIKKKLVFKGLAMSKAAKKKIEKAGGTIK